MLEVWRPVVGYVNYKVSSSGKVMNSNGVILKTHYNRSGYEHVGLYKNSKKRHEYIHRLVALAFIPKPDNKPEVNHIDEDKSNNIYTNLEWCDRKYNMNYVNVMITRAINMRRAVLVIYPNGTREIIQNVSKFARDNNLNNNRIYDTVRGKQKTHGGYRFVKVPSELYKDGAAIDEVLKYVR